MRSIPALAAAVLILASAPSAPAFAQPATSPLTTTAEAADCRAEEAALVQAMDAARARGRMLQRRQLAEQLEAVQRQCGTRPDRKSVV